MRTAKKYKNITVHCDVTWRELKASAGAVLHDCKQQSEEEKARELCKKGWRALNKAIQRICMSSRYSFSNSSRASRVELCFTRFFSMKINLKCSRCSQAKSNASPPTQSRRSLSLSRISHASRTVYFCEFCCDRSWLVMYTFFAYIHYQRASLGK